MIKLRKIAKRIPLLPVFYKTLLNKYEQYQLRGKSPEDVFTDIYKNNGWMGKESVSGTGSDDDQTRVIVKEIPRLLKDFSIETMLDVPCGDFNWMQRVDLSGVDYLGGDIVKELIQRNNEKYAARNIRFANLNLLTDKLPKVDLIFCRDCLVHFSFENIFSALKNICDSQSEYFLTTTFTDQKENANIVTGQWRPLNLQAAPFSFPEPLKTINEECTEFNGQHKDKSLALWKIPDLREKIKNQRL